ncbi:MAG: S-methyl-5-thioribose-1-phosphate isomerase [Thermodesulfovibrionales bacterium]|nr:S-methyl-5-thioribose-1-phosphate isomerase [Thermodesulfovibrionales bacterium]
MVETIRWADDRIFILDQRLLPHEIRYIECLDYLTVADTIKNLAIRGAPAIGIAAAMAVALASKQQNTTYFEGFYRNIKKVMDVMISTRPTAVNIQWAMNRIDNLILNNSNRPVDEIKSLIVEEALQILQEDIKVNKTIGEFGSQLIKDGYSIITHCNAGSLATGGYGTATAVIYTAHSQGKKIKVFADETRPVLQGARLTSWELMQNGIDVTLITDNAAGWLMKKGLINIAIVGTDRTVRNGDVANKIGTYSLAVLCHRHGIPFYVAAPTSSIDFSIEKGDDIPIEQRDDAEVTTIQGQRIAPMGIKVMNPAFDVTPAELITGIITEKGIFKPSEITRLITQK